MKDGAALWLVCRSNPGHFGIALFCGSLLCGLLPSGPPWPEFVNPARRVERTPEEPEYQQIRFVDEQNRRPILGIYTFCGERDSPVPEVALAVWEDGKIVWAKEPGQIPGPPATLADMPYCSSRITTATLFQAISTLDEHEAFSPENLKNPAIPFHACVVRITIKMPGHCLYMSMYEEGKRMAGANQAAHNESAFSNSDAASGQMEQSEEYARFRRNWFTVKRTLMNLIPPGECPPCKVRLRRDYDVFWEFE